MQRRMRTLALWWRHPGFRFLVPLIAGILSAKFLVPDLTNVILPLLVGIAILLASLPIINSRPGRSFVLSLAFIPAIFWAGVELRKDSIRQEALPTDSLFICALQEDASPTDKSFRVRARLFSTDGTDLACNAMLYIRRQGDSINYNAGDRILCQGSLQAFNKALNPGQFDALAHFSNIDLDGRLYVDSANYIILNDKDHYKLRVKLRNWRRNAVRVWNDLGIIGDAGAVAAAMVLGDERGFPADLRQAFADAGVVHVLSVSGMHASIIFVMVSEFLKLFLRGARAGAVRALVAALAIWLYAMLSGLSPSVVRASALISLAMGGLMLQRRNERAGMLAMAAALIFLFQPGMLFRTGFQLSFMAVLGIIMLNKIGRLPISNPFLLWLVELLLVSVAAQLLTTPLSLLYFHRFPVYFLLSNLVLVPLASAGLWLCIIALALSFIPLLNLALAWLAGSCLSLMVFLVKWIATLPGSVIDSVYIGPWSLMLSYLLIFALWYWLNFRKPEMLKYIVGMCILLVLPALHFEHASKRNQELIIYSAGAWPVLDVLCAKFVWQLDALPDDKREYISSGILEPCRIIKGCRDIYCLGPPLQPGELRSFSAGGIRMSVLSYPEKYSRKMICDSLGSVLLAGGRKVPDTLELADSVRLLILCDTWKKPVIIAGSGIRVYSLREGAIGLRPGLPGRVPELFVP